MGDFGFGGGFGGDPGIPDPTTGILIGIVDGIISALQYMWNVLVAAINAILGALQAIGQFFASILPVIARAIAHLATEFYDAIIKPLIDELVKIEHWLATNAPAFFHDIARELQRIERAIANVIATVQGIVGAWIDLYNKYIGRWVRKAIGIISGLRTAISLFRILGFKWAAKLDATLANVEGYIFSLFAPILETVNSLVSWMQLIADPTQIIRKGFWTSSLWANMGSINPVHAIQNTWPVSAGEKTQAQTNLALMRDGNPQVTANADGSVTLSPTLLDMQNRMAADTKLYNPTVPGYTGPQ